MGNRAGIVPGAGPILRPDTWRWIHIIAKQNGGTDHLANLQLLNYVRELQSH